MLCNLHVLQGCRRAAPQSRGFSSARVRLQVWKQSFQISETALSVKSLLCSQFSTVAVSMLGFSDFFRAEPISVHCWEDNVLCYWSPVNLQKLSQVRFLHLVLDTMETGRHHYTQWNFLHIYFTSKAAEKSDLYFRAYHFQWTLAVYLFNPVN